jgi:uncharacterized membrane protein YwzB
VNKAGCPYVGITYEHVIRAVLIALQSLKYDPPPDELLARIQSLTLGLSEFLEEVNMAYSISMKTKTVDARERYNKLSMELEEGKRELSDLLALHGAIGWNLQEQALDSLLLNNNVTNANLRKIIRTIRIDFRSKSLEIETHLKQTLREEIYTDWSNAL